MYYIVLGYGMVWYGIVCKGGYGWVGMVSTWGLTLMIYLIDG